MRVGIVGAGALGSVLGGLLYEGGVDVVLVRRDREAVELIKKNGLHLEGVSGDRTLNVKITADPSDAGKVDLALVVVKAYDTRDAVPTIKEILAEDGLVLTLQNGVGNYEILGEFFGDRVMPGTTTIGALSLGGGEFRHTGFGQTRFGDVGGTLGDKPREVARTLEAMNAGPVEVVDNPLGTVWSKLVINAAINAPATLLRLRNGELPAQDSGRELIERIVEECLSVVTAKGVSLIFDDPAQRVVEVCEGTAANINSMFQDIRAGRRTEIDFINGAVAKEASFLGISAPVNNALALLVKTLESTGDKRVED